VADDPLTEAVERIAADTGRIASSLEALVHRLATRTEAPRVVCARPPGGGDRSAPVNLAKGPETLFINLQLVGNEPATVGAVTVHAPGSTAQAVIHRGSARVDRAQIDAGDFFVVELAVGPEMHGPLTAYPQQPLELRVRVTPGTYPGGTIAVIPLKPAGEMGSRPGWLPHDAYDAPEAALRA
jgi:hypothetical protein